MASWERLEPSRHYFVSWHTIISSDVRGGRRFGSYSLGVEIIAGVAMVFRRTLPLDALQVTLVEMQLLSADKLGYNGAINDRKRWGISTAGIWHRMP